MSFCAEITTPAAAFRLGRLLQAPGIRVEPIRIVPIGDQPLQYLWFENGQPGMQTLEQQVTAHESVRSFTEIDAVEAGRLYRLDWEIEPGGLIDLLDRHDVIVHRVHGTPTNWRFWLFCPEPANLSRFHHACRSADIQMALERTYRPGGLRPIPTLLLTDPQREAILLAYEAGYFESPRQTTLEELGEELGISRQAVSDRLRRGFHELIRATLRDPPT